MTFKGARGVCPAGGCFAEHNSTHYFWVHRKTWRGREQFRQTNRGWLFLHRFWPQQQWTRSSFFDRHTPDQTTWNKRATIKYSISLVRKPKFPSSWMMLVRLKVCKTVGYLWFAKGNIPENLFGPFGQLGSGRKTSKEICFFPLLSLAGSTFLRHSTRTASGIKSTTGGYR